MNEFVGGQPQPCISTVAGNGKADWTGDGCCATTTALNQPFGVATDAVGNVYIADYYNHRVRMVKADSGAITTIAGYGASSFSGDGACATLATLNYPAAVAVDSSGNVYIADQYNNRVRRVDSVSGVITTLAGIGSAAFSGDGGPATAAQLYYPLGVAVDGNDNVYIADTNNQRVRKVDAETGVITTVAGIGSAGFAGDGGLAIRAQLYTPDGVAVDSTGNLYIADTNNHRVRKVDVSTGVITTVAGTGGAGFSGDGGPATLAQLYYPEAITVDSSGHFFIGDRGNNRVRMVNERGVISTVAGNGTATWRGEGTPAYATTLNQPRGVAADVHGNIYVADVSNHRVRKVSGVAADVQFSVSASGLPLTLTRGNGPKYPGIAMRNEGGGTVPPQNISVALPEGRKLQFESQAGSKYQLTVADAAGNIKNYVGSSSGDKQVLTFLNVDLALPGKGSTSTAWLAVTAASDAPLGMTSLKFSVGRHDSPSTSLDVV